ncbi:DUF1853 family protein [Patiriisocius marinus]|uniref:DUF1853 domain-containing protein n=1 Tax=Patiriisocius marinus TaxID=1397112 RepID=A0A5J4J172_9FLAO|nr:DUF1853 family protein [Patiriisocius marinus]GER59740.1 hypothetical protein ULMA_18480 [Patiriisocius marinus]
MYENFSFTISENKLTEDYKLPDIILGKQAEAIFEHLLSISSKYKLLASNRQIQNEKITIGEIDYLVQNLETEAYIHVEVACKFYLLDEAIESEFEGKWIGPNRKDTLLDKLNKLKEKQFPLLHRQESKRLLSELNIKASQFKQEHCILTSLYIPQKIDLHTLPIEYQECVVGTWISFEDLKLKSDYSYALPSKKQWLLPAESIENWLDHNEATIQINISIKEKRAVQVYEKKNAINRKFFVVWW